MATIVTRAGKGSPLTNAEVDANFTNLNDDVATRTTSVQAAAAAPVQSVSGKTGAVTLANTDVGLGNVENKSSATIRGELTSGNVTTALGFTPYNATNPNSYLDQAGVRAAISASGSLSYNSSTGVFSYTQPTNVSTFTNDSGYITASTVASTYAPISTTVTLTSAQTLSDKTITGLKETRLAVAASDINLNLGNWFTKTITGSTTFTISNTPTSGTAASFILELTNGGTNVIYWTGVKWAGGTAPTLTVTGRDVLGFYTHDGGTTWTGLVLGRDVK